MCALLCWLTPFHGIAELRGQQPSDERVVVTANAYPVPFESLTRSVTIITREEIPHLPVRSVAELLAYAVGIDVRSRAPRGVQADFSMRGSAYSQVLILVDGLRINDSQTAHHNADLPVSLDDIERIEILHGPGSALYGADAFGGTVNIITRKSAERMDASISAGGFGYVDGSFRAGLQKGRLNQSISAFGNRSSGFMTDRDFRTLGFDSRISLGGNRFAIAYMNKEFGANGFYGPSPSREWTNQTLVSYQRGIDLGRHWQISGQSFYRTHGDRFLWDQRQPGLFENQHRTHAIGAALKARRTFSDRAAFSFGVDAGSDWILSTNLGHHSYSRWGVFGEVQWKPWRAAELQAGVRYDRYSNFGASASPSLSAGWWVLPALRLRSSVGHAFRIPTFTELYYRDPGNQASSTLRPETSWSADAGADVFPGKGWAASATAFLRAERNVIDWVRASQKEKWQSANIRRLNFKGVELGLQRSLGGSNSRLEVQYSFLSGDPGQVNYFSKYALDYARHTWTAGVSSRLPLSLEFTPRASWRSRALSGSYWLLESRLSRPFGDFSVDLDCTNILNTRYQEVVGVDMPGRWFILGVRWKGRAGSAGTGDGKQIF